MSKLNDLIQKVDFNKQEYVVYNFLKTIYNWEDLTEEEFNTRKKSLYALRVPVLESQDFLIDEQKIGKTTYTCCHHYSFASVQDDTVVDYSVCNVRSTLRKDCICQVTDEDVDAFEAVASLRGFDVKTLQHLYNIFEYDSKKKLAIQNIITNEIVEEVNNTKKIAKLPEEYSSKLPEDLADLILEEKIRLIGYGTFNGKTFIRYKLLF